MNCYDSEIWRPSNFDSQQRCNNKCYFVLTVSVDTQLFMNTNLNSLTLTSVK